MTKADVASIRRAVDKSNRAADRAAKKVAKKDDKKRKKAAAKEYDRRHAQLKRTQALHSTLLAAQTKRAKKQQKRDAS